MCFSTHRVEFTDEIETQIIVTLKKWFIYFFLHRMEPLRPHLKLYLNQGCASVSFRFWGGGGLKSQFLPSPPTFWLFTQMKAWILRGNKAWTVRWKSEFWISKSGFHSLSAELVLNDSTAPNSRGRVSCYSGDCCYRARTSTHQCQWTAGAV